MKTKKLTRKDERFMTVLLITMVVMYFLVVVILGSVLFG